MGSPPGVLVGMRSPAARGMPALERVACRVLSYLVSRRKWGRMNAVVRWPYSDVLNTLPLDGREKAIKEENRHLLLADARRGGPLGGAVSRVTRCAAFLEQPLVETLGSKPYSLVGCRSSTHLVSPPWSCTKRIRMVQRDGSLPVPGCKPFRSEPRRPSRIKPPGVGAPPTRATSMCGSRDPTPGDHLTEAMHVQRLERQLIQCSPRHRDES